MSRLLFLQHLRVVGPVKHIVHGLLFAFLLLGLPLPPTEATASPAAIQCVPAPSGPIDRAILHLDRLTALLAGDDRLSHQPEPQTACFLSQRTEG